jgi:type IV pilus assembly protein PilC
MKKILDGMISEISSGSTFSDALSKYPKIFPNLMVSMVKAGEQSGTLSGALAVTATQMENTYNLEKRVKGALIYPAVIISLMVVVGVLLFIFVVPTLMNTFKELNVQLPLSTRIVIWFSDLLKNDGLYVLIFVVVFGTLLYLWSRSVSGKKILNYLVLKLPIVGPLVMEVNAARTARTLSSLLSAGVDVVQSVNITAAVVQNVHFRAVLEKAAGVIKTGEPMSKVFVAATKLYPVFMSEMMSVGEETGKTQDMLLNVAKYYESDVDEKTKDMSTVIEPLLMIVIGAAVGFFALSMITPIYSLVNAV